MSDLGRVLIITDESMAAHDPGPGHPERPPRLRAILDDLRKRPMPGVAMTQPSPAPRGAISRVHDSQYIDSIDSLRGRTARLDEDTAVSPKSVEAAYLAAGAAIASVDQVVANPQSPAFALVRPPGHHAERDRAMGFCLFNNIAIAAEHALAEHGLSRVLIVDWDVHHGNGTQHSFYDRRDVLVFNTHQHRLFPNTGEMDEVGEGDGRGYTVNCPMPPRMNDATYMAVFERLLVPIADKFRPEIVLVSAGFDAHCDDPLGGMALTEDGFANLCAIVKGIADRHANGRLALVLEGGYNLDALARSVRACVEILAGGSPPSIANSGVVADQVVNVLLNYHRRFWPI